ncbi:hypothetical protein HHI36_018128 [Cryptolaemus montrouzieri]|uniref:Major facilitator superfamily (MFS) profile domain-containing protein n=1 Tax=Cryptolaemus montrouzieri TaxID=559131 RepID=A0ABD2NZ69_9CUCU
MVDIISPSVTGKKKKKYTIVRLISPDLDFVRSNIGPFVVGTSIGWSSTVIPRLGKIDDNPLGRPITSTEGSLLVSIPVIGVLLSTFYSGYSANLFGRRPSLIYLGIPIFTNYVIMAYTTTIWEVIVARFLAGISTGGILTVNIMYLTEIAEVANRGFLGPLTSFFWFHIILSMFPIIYISLSFIFLPESPLYLYLIQKDDRSAENTLKKLRGTNDVKIELENMKESVENLTYLNLVGVIRSRRYLRELVIGVGLIFFATLTGNAVFSSYNQTIIAESGNATSSDLAATIIVTVQFLVGFVLPYLTNKYGRKILLLISFLSIVLAELALGTYFILKDNGQCVNSFSLLPVASLIIYNLAYSAGAGSVSWLIIGEIYPVEIKAVATSLCTSIMSINDFVLLLTFNTLQSTVGIGMMFLIFSGFGMMGIVFVYMFVIETKGKSLMEIQELLNR